MVAVSLDVVLSALGSSMDTKIAGQRAQLRLPGPPAPEEDGHELIAPAFEHIQDGERLRQWMEGTAPAWGKCYYGPNSDGGGAAWVRRCALVLPVAQARSSAERQEVADAVYTHVDRWRSLVLDWMEVALRQAPRVDMPSRSGTAIQPWLWSHDGRERVDLYNSQPLTVDAWGLYDAAADAAALQLVLRRAGDLDRPPLAWLLTRDAERAQAAGEHRRAVLDAGTAAELALSALLPQHGQMLKGTETLGSLVNKAVGVPMLNMPHAKIGLVHVRNDAAHRGMVPSRRTAADALQISAAFVEKAWPRNGLLT